LEKSKKIYFASDVHLGLYPPERSLEREKVFVAWFKDIREDATDIYLLGDIFDFWHEYKRVVPRGFTRFLGTLAETVDSGVNVHFFTGNHDIWVYDYLPSETGVKIYREHITRELGGKKFFIGHGDGLGKGDKGYKMLKAIFTNKVLQWLFARLHPNFSMSFGLNWSKHSRYAKGIIPEDFTGEENEFQLLFAKEKLKTEAYDFFVFGHRHIPMDIRIGNQARLINLGDWINNFTYAVFDGEEMHLKAYRDLNHHEIINMKLSAD
jgi:UDP-2,3-diacylglucosamine hydrolase